MDPSVAQRIRSRRARSHASQENLIKDSSSDVSPRDPANAALNDRRRQRRRQPSADAQQHVNQAFAEDERPLPPAIERAVEDDDAEEEENIQHADRLVSHVTKEHRRKLNELQQLGQKAQKKAAASDADDDQAELTAQLQAQQDIASQRLGDIPIDQVSPVEPLPALTTTLRDRPLEQLLERARKARTGVKDPDEEQQATLGSSRRFGTSSELKLQRMLRQHDPRDDLPSMDSPSVGGRLTRFDYKAVEAAKVREEIGRKQDERTNRWQEVRKHLENAILPSAQEDFFLKVWPETKTSAEHPPPPPTDPSAVPPPTTTTAVTTADGITDGQPRTTDEAVAVDDPTNLRDPELPEERQPLLPTFGEALPIQYQRAERPLDDDEERDLEKQRYKYVLSEPLTLQEKLGDGAAQPRSLEEDGIFVGKKPIVPRKVMLRAEKRILQECTGDGKPADRWFGPDGAMTSLPNPTKFVPTRPLIDELFDPALGKEFYKAYTMEKGTGVSNDPMGSGRYRLDIDLGSVTFLHHHLMSMEHVLAMKMKQMYEHYVVRRQQRLVVQLSDRIKALKSAEINCRTLFEQNRYSESSAPKELRERLTNYQNELRQTRSQRCNEMKFDRQLLQRLLDTWKQMKELRRLQGYVTTSIRLIIKQIAGKKAKHYEHMQKQIEEEIEDEIVLVDEQYQQAKATHAEIAKKRKLQGIRKKEARKRLDRKRDAAAATAQGEEDYDQDDIDILNEEEVIVPEKPEPRKHDEIRTLISAKYQNAIRPPDEPEILLELVYSEPISTDAECTARERARRYAVQSSSSLVARILINDKLIDKTPPIVLSTEFEGQCNQIFSCYFPRTPERIKIELYENEVRFRPLLAELYLPIPETTVTSENYQLQSVEFSADTLRPSNPNQTSAVGAGIAVPIQLNDPERTYLNIEGILRAGVAWGVQDGEVLVPPDYSTSKAYQNRQMAGGMRQDLNMQAVNLSNMKNLIDWIKQSNLDPYDPDNAFLINLMKDYTGARGDSRFEMNTLQHFRLWIDESDQIDHPQKEEEVDKSLRFKLLQARKENIPDFRDYRRVPPYDYLVRKDNGVFKSYMKRQQESAEPEDQEEYEDERPTRIDIVRRQGEGKLRKMREQILARFAVTSGRKTLQEMVVEETIPNIQALRGFLATLYIEPNRPLYPARRRVEQKKVTNLAIAANRDVFILVNIISAMDLPVRRNALESERAKNTGRMPAQTERQSLVRPYVEIQFQKKIHRTSIVDGPNPSWNEELRIPFRPPDNDFDAASLQRCRDILYINVFDLVEIDLPSTDRERDQLIRKRIARNWLGSVEIPFSNIYVNGRLEGSYCLSVPNPLLGYAREKLNQPNGLQQPPASVLRMFVTMEPILAPPNTIQQSFDSTESYELLNHARRWVEELNKKFPDRDYKATVSDINGRAVFIPRFLRSLPLPPGISAGIPLTTDGATTGITAGGGGSAECQRLARFVSLIPFLSDTISFPGICDIWETSDQFLKTMAGDDEEHAVLLNNYFRTLNKKSWIAIGVSIYSGPCCFVLTKEHDAQQFATCWSVADGQDVSTLDTWNPIRSIYLLANEDNIWANIQEQDLPSRMNFNVENKNEWRPFFGGSFKSDRVQWPTVQPTDLQYEPTRSEDVEVLLNRILKHLRDKIMEWRLPTPTTFHWACQKRLQEAIRNKERSFVEGRMANTAGVEQELTEFQSTHEISGFLLQMPYTNLQAIVDLVYSTKIFEHATRDVQFALAAHIHPYPNNILAVWIYLAHLTKKN